MPQETELKLSLAAQDLPRLLSHPLLAAPAAPQRLFNTYFDTPGLTLKSRRMAVRERLAGDRWLLTVKTAGSSTGGLSRRQEWEGPTTPGTLDFAALAGALRQTPQGPVALTPSDASKAQRGLALWQRARI